MTALTDWIARQAPRSASALAAAVSATDLVHERPGFGQTLRPAPGSVLATRARARWDPEPDYIHHWLRDAGVAMLAAGRLRETDPEGWDARMAEHVSFSLRIATRAFPAANPLAPTTRADHRRFLRPDAELAAVSGAALLDEPRTAVDGTPDPERWARPQHDGPAIRALSLLRWPGRRTRDAERLIGLDLAHVQRRAGALCIGPWEEDGEHDRHAFTLFAQRAALSEAPGSLGRDDALARIDAALEGLWRADRYHLAAREGTEETDAAVVLGALLGAEAPDEPRILATAASVEAWSRAAFPVNAGAPAPLIGRNPADRYFGGNPWLPTTLGFAELHFVLSARVASTGPLPGDALTARFLAVAGAGVETQAGALLARGEAFLAAVAQVAPDDGRLPEQVDAVTGRPRSCPDLTWSHAALLSALGARQVAQSALSAARSPRDTGS